MDRATEQFVEQMGLLTEEDGLPRIAGRIFGYLLLQPDERPLEQIAAALGVSRASVSTDARRLAQMGLIERRSRPGDRRDYYMVSADGVRRMIETRIRAIRRFHDVLVTAQDLPMEPEVRERIRGWDEAHQELLGTFTAMLERLEARAETT